MTNRERIIGTLTGRETDRPPFGVGLGFFPWGGALQRWREESGISDLDPAVYFGYDPPFITVPVEYGPFPHFEPRVISQEGDLVVSVDFRGIVTRGRIDGESMPEFLDYPVKTPADWTTYKQERLKPRFEERLLALPAFAEQARVLDAPVQAGTFPWGVFGTLRDVLGVEELLLGFYLMPDTIRDMIQTYTDLWLRLYAAIQDKVGIDHIHIWEDMSGRQGSLISMAMVEEFMMPAYDRIHAFAAEHDIPLVSVDSDGNVSELVPTMVRHGVNVFLPFEVQAGNDIEAYRREFPELGMIGGLDKNTLADGAAPRAMHRELDIAERMLARGRYIPGCDHLIPSNVSWARWREFVLALRRMTGAG